MPSFTSPGELSVHSFLFPATLGVTWTCCSRVCLSADKRKSGFINRNEPSGTHVENVEGGGGDGIDSGTGKSGANEGSVAIGAGLDPFSVWSTLTVSALPSMIKQTHISSSTSFDLGETDFAFDNLSPSSLAGKLFPPGRGRLIWDNEGNENDNDRSLFLSGDG